MLELNVMWPDTATGVHCYTAHQVQSEARHYSVHRALEVISNNMPDHLHPYSGDWI